MVKTSDIDITITEKDEQTVVAPAAGGNIYEEIPSLLKQDIAQMQLSLKNIKETLEKASRLVKGVENADLLVCIGNTGCGKSTLLASLIYGT